MVVLTFTYSHLFVIIPMLSPKACRICSTLGSFPQNRNETTSNGCSSFSLLHGGSVGIVSIIDDFILLFSNLNIVKKRRQITEKT